MQPKSGRKCGWQKYVEKRRVSFNRTINVDRSEHMRIFDQLFPELERDHQFGGKLESGRLDIFATRVIDEQFVSLPLAELIAFRICDMFFHVEEAVRCHRDRIDTQLDKSSRKGRVV